MVVFSNHLITYKRTNTPLQVTCMLLSIKNRVRTKRTKCRPKPLQLEIYFYLLCNRIYWIPEFAGSAANSRYLANEALTWWLCAQFSPHSQKSNYFVFVIKLLSIEWANALKSNIFKGNSLSLSLAATKQKSFTYQISGRPMEMLWVLKLVQTKYKWYCKLNRLSKQIVSLFTFKAFDLCMLPLWIAVNQEGSLREIYLPFYGENNVSVPMHTIYWSD